MTENTNDVWYQVDTGHGSYNAMLNSAANEHSQHAPGTVLSVYLNNAGDEALVKIRTDGNYNPGWENAPFVIRKFNPADHHEAQAMMYTLEWARPEPE